MAAAGEGLRLRPVRTRGSHGEVAGGWDDGVEEAVTPTGRMFFEKSIDCHILCVLGFQNPVDLVHMKGVLQETLVKHKRFRSRVENLGTRKPKWITMPVKMDQHVQEVVVSETEKSSTTLVEDFISTLAGKPAMDRSQPQWEAYVLNTSWRGANGFLIFRIHHAVGDGTSLMSLLLACTRQVAHPDLLPTIPGTAAKGKDGVETDIPPSFSSTSVEKLGQTKAKEGFLQWLWLQLIFIANTLVFTFDFLAMVIWVKDTKTAVKAEAGAEAGEHRLAFSDEISLHDVMTLRRAVGGATINDIILATIAGGLHHYLSKVALMQAEQSTDASGGLEKPLERKSNAVPLDKVFMRGLTLVNLRAKPGLQELEKMMTTGSEVKWGNSIGYLLLPLPVGHMTDPLDRIRKVKAVVDRKKRSYEAAVSYFNCNNGMKIGGAGAVAQLTYRAATQTTMALANLIGPAEEVSLGGNPLRFVIPTVVGTPQSLTIHAQSYCGSVRVGALAATAIVPDPNMLCRCFMDAFEEMLRAAEET